MAPGRRRHRRLRDRSLLDPTLRWCPSSAQSCLRRRRCAPATGADDSQWSEPDGHRVAAAPGDVPAAPGRTPTPGPGGL